MIKREAMLRFLLYRQIEKKRFIVGELPLPASLEMFQFRHTRWTCEYFFTDNNEICCVGWSMAMFFVSAEGFFGRRFKNKFRVPTFDKTIFVSFLYKRVQC